MKVPFLSRSQAAPEKRSVTMPVWLHEWAKLRESTSGRYVDEQTALRFSALFACVTLLADMVSSLPLPIYRRLQPRGKERATDYPLYAILHDQANPEMTSFQWRNTLQMHLGTWGNAFCHIEFAKNGGAAGRASELWPITPWRVRRELERGVLLYKVRDVDGSEVSYLPNEILHIMWVSLDGRNGLSPVGLAREAVGLGLAAEEYGARFFGNDARPSFVLEHPDKLSDAAYERLKDDWDEDHKGLSKSHRHQILEEGMKLQEVGIPPEDAQFLETRRFQVEEIARWYRIPPHVIGDVDRSTSWGTGIEQQNIGLLTYTLRPWLVRWEQALNSKLIPENERSSYFVEFLVDGMLRGDIAARYAAYSVGRQWGWLSANDIRELENLNPIDAGGGDDYLVPLNMTPMGESFLPAGSATSGKAVESRRHMLRVRGATGRRRLRQAYRRLFLQAGGRIVRREEADVMRAAKKAYGSRAGAGLTAFLEEYYGVDKNFGTHGDYVRSQMEPVVLSFMEAMQGQAAQEIGVDADVEALAAFAATYTASLVGRWVGSSRGQIGEVLSGAAAAGNDIVEALQGRFDEWRETRADKLADWESKQAGNAIANDEWSRQGYQSVVVGSATACENICQAMDGQSVKDVGYPPFHDGCECDIGPG